MTFRANINLLYGHIYDIYNVKPLRKATIFSSTKLQTTLCRAGLDCAVRSLLRLTFWSRKPRMVWSDSLASSSLAEQTTCWRRPFRLVRLAAWSPYTVRFSWFSRYRMKRAADRRPWTRPLWKNKANVR